MMKRKKLIPVFYSNPQATRAKEYFLKAIEDILLLEQGGSYDEKNSSAVCPFISRR